MHTSEVSWTMVSPLVADLGFEPRRMGSKSLQNVSPRKQGFRGLKIQLVVFCLLPVIVCAGGTDCWNHHPVLPVGAGHQSGKDGVPGAEGVKRRG